MSRVGLLALALLLSLVLTPGCGRNDPEVVPHGLTAAPVVPAPEGDPIPLFDDVRPGAWRVDVTKHWTESRAGGPAREGTARLALAVEIRREGDQLRSVIEVAVLETSGLASRFVEGFDGLKVSLAHDSSGRPDPATLRFETEGSPRARSFLRGLWLAGLAGSTPWFPAGDLRVGDAWPRTRLGEEAYLMATGATGGERPTFSGGGRVLGVEEVGGETVVQIGFDGVVATEITLRNEAMSTGMHDTGTARIRARDGLPLSWTFAQEYRLRHVRRGIRDTRDIRLEVEAKTTAIGPGTPSDPDDG